MKIKLLQWNILYKENIDNIISELKRIDADIVCVQELWFEKGSNAVAVGVGINRENDIICG